MNEVKEEFRSEARQNPEKFFPTDVLENYGYVRRQCEETGRYFWTTDPDRTICGDVDVIGEYTFLTDDFNTPEWSYTDVWSAFKSFFEDKGYTAIDRYPVTARWRDDADFVAASIYDFQPHVVNGDAEPPANPLVLPQYCLRFNDIENVGVTMSHTTGFTMIGQHAFDDAQDWDQNKYFQDLLDWFLVDVGIDKDELILHEDVWSGGGNLGPCIEFFAGGLELANQVYMLYEVNDGERKDIPIKVLDMGLGHERVAWFASNAPTLYHATFPQTLEKARRAADLAIDEDALQSFIPYAARLNADEVDNVDKAWDEIADQLGEPTAALKDRIKPFTDLVSVVEHTRSLLVALSDGALPSNVRGGHNLRVILRRSLNILRSHDWDLSLGDLVDWHADELNDLFPDLSDHTDHVKQILSVEEDKYEATKQDHERLIQDVMDQGGASDDELIELYDSHGLDPEELKRRAEDHGVTIDIPDDFWRQVTQRHSHDSTRTHTSKNRRFDDVEDTERLYYDHFDDVEFTGVVESIVEDDDVYHVALNRSAFYPTSGGQQHDTGTLNDDTVVDVYTEGGVVVHVLPQISFEEGDMVDGNIDFDRRLQLSQHHTATHIMTGCARELFGEHVYQAGAKKTLEKARLDITHYDSLSREDERRLEEAVNDVIEENLPVTHRFYDRKIAEQKHGFSIYQGGAVPGNSIRIVSIDGLDHEACGGTHVPVTGDVKHVELTKSSKKQDGVVRLEFLAGERAREKQRADQQTINTLLDELSCDDPALIPGRAEEVFQKWKDIKKDKIDEFSFESEERYDGDVIDEAANRLKTQRKHVVKTVRKFKDKIDDLLA